MSAANDIKKTLQILQETTLNELDFAPSTKVKGVRSAPAQQPKLAAPPQQPKISAPKQQAQQQQPAQQTQDQGSNLTPLWQPLGYKTKPAWWDKETGGFKPGQQAQQGTKKAGKKQATQSQAEPTDQEQGSKASKDKSKDYQKGFKKGYQKGIQDSGSGKQSMQQDPAQQGQPGQNQFDQFTQGFWDNPQQGAPAGGPQQPPPSPGVNPREKYYGADNAYTVNAPPPPNQQKPTQSWQKGFQPDVTDVDFTMSPRPAPQPAAPISPAQLPFTPMLPGK